MTRSASRATFCSTRTRSAPQAIQNGRQYKGAASDRNAAGEPQSKLRQPATLGPESGHGETPGNARVRTESQGFGNTRDRESAPNALGTLSVSAVTQLGEPVGTNSPAGFLAQRSVCLGGMASPRERCFRRSRDWYTMPSARSATPVRPQRGRVRGKGI